MIDFTPPVISRDQMNNLHHFITQSGVMRVVAYYCDQRCLKWLRVIKTQVENSDLEPSG